MSNSLAEELIKAAYRIERYEDALTTIYQNVARTCQDAFLKHCILRTIEGVMPDGKRTELLDHLQETEGLSQ